MALTFSTAMRDALANLLESTVNVNATVQSKLTIYSGNAPGVNAALSGNVLLADFDLPINWLNDSATGVKTLVTGLSTTAPTIAGGPLVATFFRITNIGRSQTWVQGNVGTSGSDLNLSNTSIATGNTVTISTFTLTTGNA